MADYNIGRPVAEGSLSDFESGLSVVAEELGGELVMRQIPGYTYALGHHLGLHSGAVDMGDEQSVLAYTNAAMDRLAKTGQVDANSAGRALSFKISHFEYRWRYEPEDDPDGILRLAVRIVDQALGYRGILGDERDAFRRLHDLPPRSRRPGETEYRRITLGKIVVANREETAALSFPPPDIPKRIVLDKAGPLAI